MQHPLSSTGWKQCQKLLSSSSKHSGRCTLAFDRLPGISGRSFPRVNRATAASHSRIVEKNDVEVQTRPLATRHSFAGLAKMRDVEVII
jgi:hypothetical protein